MGLWVVPANALSVSKDSIAIAADSPGDKVQDLGDAQLKSVLEANTASDNRRSSACIVQAKGRIDNAGVALRQTIDQSFIVPLGWNAHIAPARLRLLSEVHQTLV